MRSRNQRLRRGLALATVVSALAAPTAWAAPVEPPLPGPQPEPRTVVVSEPSTTAANGFDWGDAGIGAAGVFALAAIAGGAATITGYRLGRQTVA